MPSEQSALDAHLVACKFCREFAASVAHQAAALQNLPIETASAKLSRHLVAPRRGWLARIWNTRVSVPIPVVVAIVFVVAGGSFAIVRKSGTPKVDSPQLESSIEYVQVEVVPASSARPLNMTTPANKE
ncbi:MAG: hypothetical protein NDJ18_04675 [candidate division Zixibacteria bacterium]|nr:hypothetical protein [candidate division Zixibacteria bacterium]